MPLVAIVSNIDKSGIASGRQSCRYATYKGHANPVEKKACVTHNELLVSQKDREGSKHNDHDRNSHLQVLELSGMQVLAGEVGMLSLNVFASQ